MPKLLLTLLLLLFACACTAKEAEPAAEDPVLEKRVMSVADELRCLVCQNQTIADSHAELAVDLRGQIREQLKAGASEQAIIDYMVARYGDFVLYRPPVKATTVLLWFGPFALLLGAAAFLIVYLRRRRQAQQADVQLDETQRARVRELLGEPAERT